MLAVVCSFQFQSFCILKMQPEVYIWKPDVGGVFFSFVCSIMQNRKFGGSHDIW